jgi:hypothetical protein
MAESEAVPSHIAGYTIMGKRLRLGIFGADYLGHNNDGLRLLKVLGEGEGISLPEETYATLKDDAQLLHFEPGQILSQEQRVLTANTVQSAALGVVVGGSPLQAECVDTTREFDADQKGAALLRSTTLVQKVQLVRALAQTLERLHKEGKTFPYLTPWNVLIDADQPKLAEVGLGLRPDDPKFSKDKLHEDVLVYLAPEVIRAIAEGSVVQVSPAADVYALAATARSFFLNKVADPAAPAGAPATKDAAPPNRRELTLKGGGVAQAPHQLYSRDLEQLLARCLSSDPGRRPSAGELAEKLGLLVTNEQLVWTPPSQAPKYAAIAAGVVGALVLVVIVFMALQPPAGLVKARMDYAAATREQDPAKRKALLEGATLVGEDGTSRPIPEAQRLLALEAFKAWAREQKGAAPPAPPKPGDKPSTDKSAPAPAAPGAEALEAVIAGLEEKVAGSNDDDLARAARFVAAVLRRFEQANPQAREKAKPVLEALAKAEVKPESLRKLAEAAQALTATGVEGKPTEDQLRVWQTAATEAAADAGFLAMAYAPPKEINDDPSIVDKPVGVSLEAAWLGRLLGGRLQDMLGQVDDARNKLAAAREATSIFATEAAYGLMLAANGTKPEDIAAARAAIDAAVARHGPFAEASLAVGKGELKAGLAGNAGAGDPAALRRAAEAFQAATGAPADTPGVDVAKVAAPLEAQARFAEAIALAMDAAQADLAEAALEAFLKKYEGTDLTDTYGPDARLARGLVRARRGEAGAAAAKADLLALFKNGDPSQGEAPLPPLEPVPPTRAAAKGLAIGTLIAGYLESIEKVPTPPTKEWVTAADRDLKAAMALKELPGAQIDAPRMSLAEAGVELARARAFDGRTGEQALEKARAAFGAALDKLTPDKNPEQWLKALEGNLEVFLAQAERMTGAEVDKVMQPLSAALAALNGAGANIPRALTRTWEQFQPKMLGRIRGAISTKVQTFVDERKATWARIDPANPKAEASDEQVTRDIAVVTQATTLWGDQVPDAERYRVAQYEHYLALLYRAKGGQNGLVYDHAEAGLKLLEGLSEDESKHTDLKKNLSYVVGVIALKEPESLKSKVRDTRAYALDALARACGARDFNDLKAKVKAGQTPVGPPGRENDPSAALAADIVARYDNEQAIPKDPAFGTPIPNAATIEGELTFASQIDRRSGTALLLLARVLFSIGAEKADACAEKAQAAMTLAAGGTEAPQLAVTVQAARLYCFARFKRGEATNAAAASEVARGADFRRVALSGRDAANRLFERDKQQAQFRYNYGPAYWYARSLYEEGLTLQRNNRPTPEIKTALEGAKAAYEEYRKLIETRDTPAEATNWQRELQNIGNLIRALPAR